MTFAILVTTFRIMVAVKRMSWQSSYRESNSCIWKNEKDMEEQVHQPETEDDVIYSALQTYGL